MIPDEISLEEDFEFFVDQQQELLKTLEGKVVAIKGKRVLGVFDDEISAVAETAKRHSLGTFIVQRVERGTDSYTQTFHSRAMFP